MKNFLFRIVVLFFSICLIQLVTNFALPAYWGNEVIFKKFSQQKKFDSTVNTLFIGTSRIHYHIDPIQFDSNTKQKTNSYNVSSQGTAGLESFKIIDEIIRNSEKNNINTIFMEVPSFNLPADKNLNSVRATYYIGPKQMYMALKYHLDKNTSLISSIKVALKAGKITLVNLLGLHTFKPKFKIFRNSVFENSRLNRDSKRGFRTLDRSVARQSILKPRLKMATDFYSKHIKDDSTEIEFLTETINKQIKNAQEKGITIIYILMPKMSLTQYKDIYHSFNQLKGKNKLNLSNPKKYPKFYKHNFSSDKVHLNSKGAKSMTKEFANHYNEFI